MYIDESTIDEKINSEMHFKWALRVPGITKFHMIHCRSHSAKLRRKCGYQLDQTGITVHFNPGEPASLETKDKSAIENDAENENTDFEVGDWVVVQYNKQKYLGEIIDVLKKKVVISAMHPAGNCFKWKKGTVFI